MFEFVSRAGACSATAFDRSCCCSQAKRPKQAPQTPPSAARRVGGGYEIVYLPGSPCAAAAAAQAAAAAADQLLTSGLKGPLSEQDLLIIRHIIKAAEAAAVQDCRVRRASSSHISLAQLLQAYETVLPQHGLLPQEDTHYYCILLKLGLDPDHDWWQRFHRERQAWSR